MSSATRRTIGGVLLLVSPAVTPCTIWGTPAARSLVVIREDTTLDVHRSAFFTADRVAVRETMRVMFLHPHAAGVQEITLDD